MDKPRRWKFTVEDVYVSNMLAHCLLPKLRFASKARQGCRVVEVTEFESSTNKKKMRYRAWVNSIYNKDLENKRRKARSGYQ